MNDNYSELPDTELVSLTRAGDAHAFGELWRRHAPAARAAARSITSTFDPDDLVSEAYVRTLTAIQNGGGPQTAFRAYVLRAVHNLAIKWAQHQRTDNIEDADSIEDPHSTGDSALRDLDRSLTAAAFRALPPRWQEVLWYVEVEKMKAQDIAPLLGIAPNAVAALTYRAREGLRQSWIQAHLNTTALSDEHRVTVERLGAFIRGGLRKREYARVKAHLDTCALCQGIASEAATANSQLAFTLVTLAVGASGAVGYLAWAHSGSTPVTVQALGSHIDLQPLPEKEEPERRRRLLIVAWVAAGTIATGALVLTLTTAQLDQGENPPPGAESVPLPTPVTPATPTPETDAEIAPTPYPTGVLLPPPTRQPGQSVSTPNPAPVPSAPNYEAPATPTSAPTISSVDTGSGADSDRWFPIFSGRATPGATITVKVGDSVVTAVVSSTGAWAAPQLEGLEPGTHVAVVQQQVKGFPKSSPSTARFSLLPGPGIKATGGGAQFHVAVSGESLANVQVLADDLSGWSTKRLAIDGTWGGQFRWFTTEGEHTVGVRYSDGTRWGPSSTTSITITR